MKPGIKGSINWLNQDPGVVYYTDARKKRHVELRFVSGRLEMDVILADPDKLLAALKDAVEWAKDDPA